MTEKLDLSDVIPPERCMEILRNMREKNDWLQALEDDDLEMLTEFMDFLPFDPGMELITKGEEASWCGIIAEGTVDVVIGGNVVAMAHLPSRQTSPEPQGLPKVLLRTIKLPGMVL